MATRDEVIKQYSIPDNPATTANIFHVQKRKAFIRGIMGPPGSGKSVMNLMEILFHARRQRLCKVDGRLVSKTRWLVIRETYQQLEDSVIKSMRDWYHPSWGRISDSKPPDGKLVMPCEKEVIGSDGIKRMVKFDAEIELLFRAVPTEHELQKLDSVEFTGVWVNEVSGIERAVVMKAIERVGRYPSVADVPHILAKGYTMETAKDENGAWIPEAIRVHGGATEPSILMDLNPPDEGHWIIDWFERGYIEGMEDISSFIKQPPAVFERFDEDSGELLFELNPAADNIGNLSDGQYRRQLDALLDGRQYDTIRQRLMMQYGRSYSGRPVWPQFDRDEHVALGDLEPQRGQKVVIGFDTSGINPALVIGQFNRGVWEIQEAAYAEDTSLETFFEVYLEPLLALNYRGCPVVAVCDPSDRRSEILGISPITWLQSRGIEAVAAPTNDFIPRIESVATLLSRKRAIVFSPKLHDMIDAMMGKYKYAEARVSGSSTKVYQSRPDKRSTRPYSDLADALQYFALYAVGDNRSTNIRALAELNRGNTKLNSWA